MVVTRVDCPTGWMSHGLVITRPGFTRVGGHTASSISPIWQEYPGLHCSGCLPTLSHVSEYYCIGDIFSFLKLNDRNQYIIADKSSLYGALTRDFKKKASLGFKRRPVRKAN